MPELPPPPPPPLSLGAALVDTLRRHRPPWATPRTLAVSAAFAAVAAAVFVVLAVRAGTMGAPPALVLPTVGSAADPGASGLEATAPGGPSDSSTVDAGTLAVHAAGAFVNPGLYELPAGSRVAQLIEAAGGPAPGAVLDAVNLAARLSDGERIYLPGADDAVDPLAAGGSRAGAAAGSTGTPVVDLNTATLEQLDSLPGVGPSTAQAILDHRRERGRFRSVDELLEVRGIGEAKLAAIRKLVRV